MAPRIQETYKNEIIAKLREEFDYKKSGLPNWTRSMV